MELKCTIPSPNEFFNLFETYDIEEANNIISKIKDKLSKASKEGRIYIQLQLTEIGHNAKIQRHILKTLRRSGWEVQCGARRIDISERAGDDDTVITISEAL